MKTDAQLKKDVEAELAWDPAVRSTEIGVAVRDGVVSLTGHIDTYAEKYAAEKAVRRVGGVKAIALELDVRLSPEHCRGDADIAAAAQQALRSHANLPDTVTVTVDRGWITLRGEVDWDYQRRNAEKAVRVQRGVVGVTSEIKLRGTVPPKAADLHRRIGEALKRQAEREAEHIDIQVQGSTVTLRGRVNSWHERIAAQGIAWSAPGVTSVINELSIA